MRGPGAAKISRLRPVTMALLATGIAGHDVKPAAAACAPSGTNQTCTNNAPTVGVTTAITDIRHADAHQ